jgi:hypothetical protein
MGSLAKILRLQSTNQRYRSWFATMEAVKQRPQATAALRMEEVLKKSQGFI